VPLVGSYPTHTKWSELENLLKEERPKKEPPELDRPKGHEYITDWDDEDLERLNLKIPPKKDGGNPLL